MAAGARAAAARRQRCRSAADRARSWTRRRAARDAQRARSCHWRGESRLARSPWPGGARVALEVDGLDVELGPFGPESPRIARLILRAGSLTRAEILALD